MDVVGRINYDYPDDLTHAVRICAAHKGQTIKEWVRLTLAAEVERQEAERAEDERRRRSR